MSVGSSQEQQCIITKQPRPVYHELCTHSTKFLLKCSMCQWRHEIRTIIGIFLRSYRKTIVIFHFGTLSHYINWFGCAHMHALVYVCLRNSDRLIRVRQISQLYQHDLNVQWSSHMLKNTWKRTQYNTKNIEKKRKKCRNTATTTETKSDELRQIGKSKIYTPTEKSEAKNLQVLMQMGVKKKRAHTICASTVDYFLC